MNCPIAITASLISVLAVFAQPPGSGLKGIVESSGAGISWPEFERLIGPERMNGLVRIGSALAHTRPREAWSSVQSLAPGDEREFLMRGVLLQQAEHDPAAGLKELMELPEGGARNVLARAFFGRWAGLAPVQAAAAVGKFTGDTRNAVLASVLVAWVAVDAPAAAQWASQLPSTESKSAAPLTIFGMAGAETLMGVHYDRGEAMQLAAFEWAKRDRRAALAWAESVADPALRGVLVGLITRGR